MHSEEDDTNESGDLENRLGEADASENEGAEDAPGPAIPGLGEDEGDEEAEGEDGEGGAEAGEELALPFDSVVEAILFASREPLKTSQIARAVAKGIRRDAVRGAMDRLNLHYLETGRAFEIAEISGRFQLMSRPEYVSHLRKLYPRREAGEKEKSTRLTPAALDTLSIIAYKQPVTRGEVERIRGVGCGAVLRALIERGTVEPTGKRTDLVGQPLTYGTTEAFLIEFGLGSLDELPLRNEFLDTFSIFDASAGSDAQPESEPQTAGDGPTPEPKGDA